MECIQLSLSGKMFPELSAQTAEKISEPCWKNLPTRHNQTFQFLDLRGGGGDGARPEQSSETAGLWHGGCSTLNVGECPSVESVSQLSQILEVNVPQRYFLSARACQGILTRASRRGKALPDLLKTALLDMIDQNCPAGHDRVVAGEAAYTLKIRSGCAGGGKGALVQTEKTGTLSTLQDQTLFQPIVFDGRGNGNGKTVPTITGDHESRVTDYTAIAVDLYNGAVTGSKAAALSCKNTGTTAGPQVAERKTYSEQTFSTYKESDSSATLKAKTGNIGNGGECLVAERVVRWIVRRLTPTECERLQGYPDGWTDIGEWTDTKGKKHKPADTPRYKALGNSIALPQWFWIAQKMRPYLKDKPTLGSLFDGIGGFPLVWETAYGAGTAVWASEIEEFPIAVTKRWFGNDTENESNSGAVLRG